MFSLSARELGKQYQVEPTTEKPGSPQSFTLDEKREICEQMESTSRAIEDAIKADFEALPPVAQARMLDLLQKADPEHFDWWNETLVGSMPDHSEGLMR